MIPGSTVYFFSFLLAFCSLFYELVFAEILSVCLGGTKIQYITTIAIFTFALGLGSITFGRVPKPSIRKTLFAVELCLMLLGSAGPFLITWLLQPGGILSATVAAILSYAVIFTVGFLSGFELPSLFALKGGSEGKILATDYIGMLAASVSFPLFFLPTLGTAASCLIVALANGAALVWLRSDSPRPALSAALYSGVIGAMLFTASRAPDLNAFLSTLYLGGNP